MYTMYPMEGKADRAQADSMASKVCVVVGAGSKYVSNKDFSAKEGAPPLAPELRWGLGGAIPLAFAKEVGRHRARVASPLDTDECRATQWRSCRESWKI